MDNIDKAFFWFSGSFLALIGFLILCVACDQRRPELRRPLIINVHTPQVNVNHHYEVDYE